MATNFNDIFDQIDLNDQTPGIDIFDQIDMDIEEPSQIARKAKIGAQALAVGAGGTYGNILDAIGLQAQEQLPGAKAQRQTEYEALEKIEEKGGKASFFDLLALSDDDDILPRYSRLPSSEEVSKIVGSEEPKDVTERWLQRAGESVGSGIALGGGAKTLMSLLAGSTAGQATKELGFSDTVADIVDIGTSLAVGIPKKGLTPKKAQAELVKDLRAKGFTDKEITPLLQSDKKLRNLSKFAKKGSETEKRLLKIKEKIGSIYDATKKEPGSLSFENISKLENSFAAIADDIRPGFARLLKDELRDLTNSEYKVKDLINFYQDINQKVKGVSGGKAILNKFKAPVMEALSDIDPKIAKDFKIANDQYAKLFKVTKALKPNQMEKLIDLGKTWGLGGALVTGNIGLLTKMIGIQGGRLLARELLLNPQLQNITKQIGIQITKNNKAGIYNATQKVLKYLKKERPDVFEELDLED